MKTQVQVLKTFLLTGWVGTAHAMNLGINSFHRRLADFRNQYPEVLHRASGKAVVARLVNGAPYRLESRDRMIQSRWGLVKIREWKLVRCSG
jgi:hypothetical protein